MCACMPAHKLSGGERVGQWERENLKSTPCWAQGGSHDLETGT